RVCHSMKVPSCWPKYTTPTFDIPRPSTSKRSARPSLLKSAVRDGYSLVKSPGNVSRVYSPAATKLGRLRSSRVSTERRVGGGEGGRSWKGLLTGFSLRYSVRNTSRRADRARGRCRAGGGPFLGGKDPPAAWLIRNSRGHFFFRCKTSSASAWKRRSSSAYP